MQEDPRLLVLCVGGGSGKEEVERMIASGVKNLRSLPYQPFDRIRYSLSAADVHVVSIGNDVVGIVHPCKVYGAMAVSRPILLLGPKHNHVSDLVERHKIGWHVEHGDEDGAQRALEQMLNLPKSICRRWDRVQRWLLGVRLTGGSCLNNFAMCFNVGCLSLSWCWARAFMMHHAVAAKPSCQPLNYSGRIWPREGGALIWATPWVEPFDHVFERHPRLQRHSERMCAALPNVRGISGCVADSVRSTRR